MEIPEVRIYFSWLLYDNVSRDLFEKYKLDNDSLISYEGAVAKTKKHKKEWAGVENKILPALMDVLQLDFYRETIDVACAPWITSQSAPLLMSFYYEPDQFIDILTHELRHVLLTDNKTYSDISSENWIDLRKRWANLFGENYDWNTLVHIPVHALCKYIWNDVLKDPRRIDRDIEDIKNNEPYIKSWEYVNSHDYREILQKLKDDYKKLKQELKGGRNGKETL